jgi:hypothetical protein
MWEKRKEIREYERRGFGIFKKKSKIKRAFYITIQIFIGGWIIITYWCRRR